jgi:hypothetical protein
MSGAQGNQEPHVEVLIIGLDLLRRVVPRLGPYLFVELLLPGGTAIALLLYLYRRRSTSLGQALLAGSRMAATPVLAQSGDAPS